MRSFLLSAAVLAPLFFSPASVAAQTPALPGAAPPASQNPAPKQPPFPAAAAAKAAAATAGAKDPYAAESFVVTKSAWVDSNKADGTGYRERTIAVRLQSEAALRSFGVIDTSFASASEHVEMHYVRVKHADGTVSETPTTDLIEQAAPVTREAPFYSDLKSAQLPVKNLRVGDTLEWQVRVVRTRAEAPNHFWGEQDVIPEGVVTLDETIELHVPANETVNVWTNPHRIDPPKVTTEGDEKVYRWHHSQLKATTGADADAARKQRETKVLTEEEETDDREGKLSPVAWTTFASWADVGAWYRALEGSRFEPDDEIKAKTAEVTRDAKTDEEKVRAIYAFVATNVRYVGVAFGIGRFQPHEAVDVLHNQYGDCKDKATLLIAMLRAAGFNPDAVLIGAGVRMNEAVPSPSAFNHLINRVKVGNEEVWLDATQEVAPYKVLLFQLRGKQALVIPDKGAATLERTPQDLPFPSLDTWTSKGTIDEKGVSETHIHMSFRSDNEVVIREAIHQVAPAQYEQVGQGILNNMGYGGTTSHTAFSRPEDTTSPFTIDVDYKKEMGDDWKNLRVIPQVGPVSLPHVDDKDPPTRSLEMGAPGKYTASSELKLPAGWSAVLPEAIHEKSHWANYDQTYRFADGVLYSERTVEVLESRVPASEWKDYKKWQDRADLGFDRYVMLMRPGADGKPRAAGTAAGHRTKQEAIDLIGKAYTEIQHMDAAAAETDLKAAKDIDPEAMYLWEDYGLLASLRGKMNEAIEDYRKELAAYPQNWDAYRSIAYAQAAQHKTSDAETTLRQWAAADPENPNPQIILAEMLYSDKNYPEAAAAAQKSLDLTKDGDEYKDARRSMLGRSLMKAGDTKKGEAVLLAVLKETDDPGQMNDAAYELADAQLDLALDDEKVRLALTKMDAETAAWTLSENQATLRQKSSLLAATWDTMGWILYREGKLEEARTYILAAYMNQHHDEVKGHLDQIDEKLGKEKVNSGRKAAQADRTVPLGPYSGPKIVAEYRLLLSHGKVERDEPVGDKSVGGGDGMLKAADFSNLFPQGSNAKLVRLGMVNCSGGKCEVVLEP